MSDTASFLESLEQMKLYSTQIHEISENLGGNAEAAFARAKEVQEKVQGMSGTVEASRKETQLLLQESGKVQSILELMRDIVGSTHVLGINATILAARAGPAGRAFGVLSKEIRTLAEESARSLRDIETIIAALQQSITRVSDRIEDSGSTILGQVDNLTMVAGYLQGTALGVDVIHTVSGTAAALTHDLLQRAETA
jgi:methyl-accepting chemotaxis protein